MNAAAPPPANARRVYCLVGVPPEIQAYAMAKYSRSSQGMLESVAELSAERAERFLNTFYFQYGHRSIADLAHLVLAIENVSILAAIRVVDEQLWDGQERSTRYQNFQRSGYEVPAELEGEARERYCVAADRLFEQYAQLARDLTTVLQAEIACPEGMEPGAYQRTLRARAFDVARQLLPLATRTSVGQVVSARVLERQISRLLADRYGEVRAIGEELRLAAAAEAESPLATYAEPVRAAPTLVRYTQPATFGPAALREVARRAAPLLTALGPVARSQTVELADSEELLDEQVATLLFSADPDGHSYRQVQELVRGLPMETRLELLSASLEGRGPHDELLREHQSGYSLKFDLLIDLGAFRDLHRHRRCCQIVQALTASHRYDDPEWVFERGLGSGGAARARREGLIEHYRQALDQAGEAIAGLAGEAPLAADYLLPLAYRVRALFKMDLAQAAYMAELRSGPAGHFSYREAAWQIYQQLSERLPTFAATLRVSDPSREIDFLKR